MKFYGNGRCKDVYNCHKYIYVETMYIPNHSYFRVAAGGVLVF